VFRLLVDHDFNERILQGVQSRAEINAVLARTVGLEDKPDAALLGWTADENRIVLSHDLQTMPGFAIARLRGGANDAWIDSRAAGTSNWQSNRGIDDGRAMQ